MRYSFHEYHLGSMHYTIVVFYESSSLDLAFDGRREKYGTLENHFKISILRASSFSSDIQRISELSDSRQCIAVGVYLKQSAIYYFFQLPEMHSDHVQTKLRRFL